eukprot:1155527-Pelagomonas_calceolata.AAC.1
MLWRTATGGFGWSSQLVRDLAQILGYWPDPCLTSWAMLLATQLDLTCCVHGYWTDSLDPAGPSLLCARILDLTCCVHGYWTDSLDPAGPNLLCARILDLTCCVHGYWTDSHRMHSTGVALLASSSKGWVSVLTHGLHYLRT